MHVKIEMRSHVLPAALKPWNVTFSRCMSRSFRELGSVQHGRHDQRSAFRFKIRFLITFDDEFDDYGEAYPGLEGRRKQRPRGVRGVRLHVPANFGRLGLGCIEADCEQSLMFPDFSLSTSTFFFANL